MRYLLLVGAASLLFSTIHVVEIRRVSGDLVFNVNPEDLERAQWMNLCRTIKGEVPSLHPWVNKYLEARCAAYGIHCAMFIPQVDQECTIGVMTVYSPTTVKLLVKRIRSCPAFIRQIPYMSVPKELTESDATEIYMCETQIPECIKPRTRDRHHYWIRRGCKEDEIDYVASYDIEIQDTDTRCYTINIDWTSLYNEKMIRLNIHKSKINVKLNLLFDFTGHIGTFTESFERMLDRYPGDSLIALFRRPLKRHFEYYFPEEGMAARFQSIPEGWEIRDFVRQFIDNDGTATLYGPDNVQICTLTIDCNNSYPDSIMFLKSLRQKNLPLREFLMLLHTTSMPRPA